MEPSSNIAQNIKSPKIVIGGLVLLLIVALGGIGYLLYKDQSPKADPKKELDAVVLKVGKLMVLPGDETPTLATVSDPAKLRDQKFFVNAKEGDKVLIYAHAGKAILYDPASNKIVEVAPINLGGQ